MVAGGGDVVGGCGDSGGGGVEVVVAGGGDVEMEIVVVVKGCGEMGNMRARWKSTYVATYWEGLISS